MVGNKLKWHLVSDNIVSFYVIKQQNTNCIQIKTLFCTKYMLLNNTGHMWQYNIFILNVAMPYLLDTQPVCNTHCCGRTM